MLGILFRRNFNPIIVLFLTADEITFIASEEFQSYYSLISNTGGIIQITVSATFQSYYSLISNTEAMTLMQAAGAFQSYYSLISNIIHL